MKTLRYAPSAYRAAVLLCAVMGVFSACKKTPVDTEALIRARDMVARKQAIAAYVDALSDDQKIAQLFLVNVEGNTTFVPVEKTGALYGASDEGEPLVPGGCLLFSYNIADTPDGIATYTASIRQFYAAHGIVPPYIAIDQEGGYVNRLRGITSNLVSQKKVAEWFTPEQAYDLYAAQAKQLRALGIQMNLAPVVEVETAENAAFLDTRSFGALEHVLSYSEAEIRAYEENGIATVLKHFPGNNNTDPHTGLPHITLAAHEVASYLAPFSSLAPQASALLMSHAVARVSAADGTVEDATDIPACFSPYWVQRARSACAVADDTIDSHLIFSDDIFMGALADNGYPPSVAVIAALEAGIHCIMLSEKQFGTVAGVLLRAYKESKNASDATDETSLAYKIDQAICTVIAYKIKADLLRLVPQPTEETADSRGGKKLPPAVSYTVVPHPDVPPFDPAAFKAAYDDGMSRY